MKKLLDKTLRELIRENRIVYINKEGTGVGKLALGGREVTGKKSLTITAQTNAISKIPVKMTLEMIPCLVSLDDVEEVGNNGKED